MATLVPGGVEEEGSPLATSLVLAATPNPTLGVT